MRDPKPHPIARVLGDAPLVAIDVGARGDVPPHWLPLDGVARIVGFEPDPEACERLREAYASRGHGGLYRNLPIGLSATGGKRTLYMTNTPSGSSLLPLDTPIAEAYVDHDYVHPTRPVEIETRRLGEVLDEIAEPRADLFKIDVQGAEAEVLDGLGEARLRDATSLELEAAIEPIYRGSSTLFSLQARLAALGFELFDAKPSHGHRSRNGNTEEMAAEVFGVHPGSPTIASRLLYVDGLWFRSRAAVLASRDAGAIRRLAAAYALYRYFVEAYALIEDARTAGALDDTAATEAQAALKAWHDLARVSRVLHRPGAPWRFARTAMKAAGMLDALGDRVAAGDFAFLRRRR